MSRELLSIHDLKKSYNGRQVLSVTAATVRSGSCVILRGANGSGKTTLLKILAGLLKPDSVAAWTFNGHPQRPSQHGINSVVYLHQSPYMFAGSVRDNVSFAARCTATAYDVDYILHKTELAAVANTEARELSGGMQQRLALARLWTVKANLYLLDEPTTHMDAEGVRLTQELVADVRQQGAAIIFSSHDDTNNFSFSQIWQLQNGDVCCNINPK